MRGQRPSHLPLKLDISMAPAASTPLDPDHPTHLMALTPSIVMSPAEEMSSRGPTPVTVAEATVAIPAHTCPTKTGISVPSSEACPQPEAFSKWSYKPALQIMVGAADKEKDRKALLWLQMRQKRLSSPSSSKSPCVPKLRKNRSRLSSSRDHHRPDGRNSCKCRSSSSFSSRPERRKSRKKRDDRKSLLSSSSSSSPEQRRKKVIAEKVFRHRFLPPALNDARAGKARWLEKSSQESW